MSQSKLDSIYRRMLITRFFQKGWGTPENLQRLFEFRKIVSQRETCYKLIPPDYPVEITKEEKYGDCTILEGKFISPFGLYLPGVVPDCVQNSYFQALLPNKWKNEKFKPMCIHLAGTGDHFFWRRRNLIAKPLLKEANIGAIILENPFYGLRKPQQQVRSCLHNVTDILVMGGCLILESLVLFHWCQRNGYGPLGITGLSMGGHMASLAATIWPKPLVLVPCLSWSTAATVFTTGVMSQSINWETLENQYYADGQYCKELSKMVTVIDDAFSAGQNFIKNINQSLEELKLDIRETDKTAEVLSSSLKTNVQKQSEPSAVCTAPIPSEITEVKQSTKVSKNDIQLLFNNILKDLEIFKSKDLGLTRLMRSIYPQTFKTTKTRKKVDYTKTNWWEHETMQFMRGVMDECTHLKNFAVPFDTSLIIAVCAKDDAYVPREGCHSLEDIWPGAEVRYLDAGHVSAYVLYQKLFRSCIIEAFERAKKKQEQIQKTESATTMAEKKVNIRTNSGKE